MPKPENIQQTLIEEMIVYNIKRNRKFKISRSTLEKDFKELEDNLMLEIKDEDIQYILSKYKDRIVK